MAIRKTFSPSSKFTKFYDTVSRELVDVLAPIRFVEDFTNCNDPVGSGYGRFAAVDQSTTGAPTIARVADQHGGVLGIQLTNNNQAEDGGVSFGDEHILSANKLFIAEFMVKPVASTNPIPSAAGENVCVGLSNDHVNSSGTVWAPDATAVRGLRFRIANGGTLTFEAKNDSGTTSYSTGVVCANGTSYVLRIEHEVSGTLKIFVNGSRVAASSPVLRGTMANVVMQPYIVVSKKSGTGTPGITVDKVSIWAQR